MNTNININDYLNQIIKEHNEAHFNEQHLITMTHEPTNQPEDSSWDWELQQCQERHILKGAKPGVPSDSPAKRKITFSESLRDRDVRDGMTKIKRHCINNSASHSTDTRTPKRNKTTHTPITQNIIINQPLICPRNIKSDIKRILYSSNTYSADATLLLS